MCQEEFCSKESCIDNDADNDDEEMILVKGGTFTMGTDLPIFVNDGEGMWDFFLPNSTELTNYSYPLAPARRVQVSNFLMDKFEVSNMKFAKFVGK